MAVAQPKQTFFTSPAKGSGVKGIELDRAYEGEWANGKRHGYGRYVYPNSFFVYEGNWENGEKHGLGKLSMKDGGYYEGEFVHGEIQGQGTRVFANGNVYVGTFVMGEMHGFGIMTLRNGDTYQGPFDHNAFEGEGVYTYAQTRDRYQGDFRQHRMTGQGTMEYANGDKYVGSWLESQRSSEGFCTYANGNTYTGAWAADKFHGEGEWYVARHGLTYKGTFDAGRPVQIPTRINVLFDIEEDPKKKKAPSKGEVEQPAPLPVVVGEPLPMPVIIAAQFEEALPPPPPEEPLPPGAKAPAKKPPTPAPAGPVTIYTEQPAPGHVFRTAAMESGRVVNLTLHKEPPRALQEGCDVRALVVPTRLPDGEMRVRLLLLFAHVDNAMHIGTVESEPVSSLQMQLTDGQCVLEGLTVGTREEAEKLAVVGGIGYLVASSWGVVRGYCRVTLPEYKEKPAAKKPGGK